MRAVNPAAAFSLWSSQDQYEWNKLEQPVPKEAHSHKTMLESALPSAILFETVSSTYLLSPGTGTGSSPDN